MSDDANEPSKGVNIGLWVVQGLLALAFMAGGFGKVTTPIDELVGQGMAYASRFPEGFVRFIGVAELLGALGLILPSATRIMPKLTVAAAGGLLIVMVSGAISHAANGEFPMIGANVILGALLGFVAWGRLKKAPIVPK